MKSICAVIVNYRRPDLTRRAVESVLESEGVETRVALVDNESDGVWARDLYGDDERVVIRANAGNIGFGAACNQGIEMALEQGCDAVLLLNNDARVESGALLTLAEAAGEHGLAAPKILLPDGRIYAAGGIVEMARARCRNRGIYEIDRGQYDRRETMRFASACALMISRRALDSGVRFHKPFFLYYEDADLCLALGEAGFSVAYTPEARVVHLESASTGDDDGHSLLYYDARNRFLFLRRCGRAGQRTVGWIWLIGTTLVKSVYFLLRGRGARARALLRGLADGLSGRMGKDPL